MNTLARLDILTNGGVSDILNDYKTKRQNKGKRKREQSQETQLRKIALAQQKRERKDLKKVQND